MRKIYERIPRSSTNVLMLKESSFLALFVWYTAAMSKHKAIIFDVDGTAVDSPSRELPSERLAAAVRSLGSTYYLSAATGRSWSWVKGVLECLELEDPCIVAAGTQICNPKTGETLWECDMDSEDTDAVMAILRTIPGCRLLYNDYSGDEYYSGGVSPDQIVLTGPVHFINCIFIPSHAAAGVIEKLAVVENLAITMAVSQKENYKDILITSKLATKEHAVAELLKLIDVEKKDAVGVGDGHNDVELFRAVGRKVAMGNAVSELKEAADEVIGDINQDGFAKFLEGLDS